MATSILELINKLEQHEDTTQVEFIVVKKTGELVCVDVDETAKSVQKVLKLFSQ